MSGYRGRFAPSPTGPLHFGSLAAAAASYLDARFHSGQWLLRMEDVDIPRSVPGAAARILRQLDSYGLHWDGPVVYQHARTDAYRSTLSRLQAAKLVFPCRCTRKQLTEPYPGTCRDSESGRAWRLRVNDDPISFVDRRLGVITERLESSIGDFILLRADGLFAYQLAVVVDDEWQGITHVVRGDDLLDSTGRQIFLQRQLDYRTPSYLHIPVVTGQDGAKLSKQTHAPAIANDDAAATIHRALDFLGYQPPAELIAGRPEELWRWALGKTPPWK